MSSQPDAVRSRPLSIAVAGCRVAALVVLTAAVLWLAGGLVASDQRLLLWIPALALELLAPVAGYWLPGRGRAVTTDWDIEGGHFEGNEGDACTGVYRDTGVTLPGRLVRCR